MRVDLNQHERERVAAILEAILKHIEEARANPAKAAANPEAYHFATIYRHDAKTFGGVMVKLRAAPKAKPRK